MTAYNRQIFIVEAIESVQNSTYQNWELIIVDDCSKDNTVSIAQAFAEKDKRIKVYINEHNLGDYPNRNKAASYATGKYLKYLDSDDRIEREALQTMLNFMEQFPGAGWGISNFLPEINDLDLPVILNNKEAYEFHYFNQPIFFASPGLSIISQKAFHAVGGFGEKRMVSDFEMWHKLSGYSPLVLMSGNMIQVRVHAGQEVQDQQKFVVDYEKIKVNYLCNEDSPLTNQQVKLIKAKRRNTAFKIAVRKLLKLDIKAAIPRLKVTWFYLWN